MANLVQLGRQGIEFEILKTADHIDVGTDVDAHFLQPLLAQAAGDAQGSGETTREMAAACYILIAAVFHLRGVVGVTGTGDVVEIGVVLGPGIFIVDDGGNGRAAGVAVQQACQKFGTVFLLAGGGPVVLAGCSAVQELL